MAALQTMNSSQPANQVASGHSEPATGCSASSFGARLGKSQSFAAGSIHAGIVKGNRQVVRSICGLNNQAEQFVIARKAALLHRRAQTIQEAEIT